MRTLVNLLLMLSLASFLFAQTDTTATETPVVEEAVTEPAEAAVEEAIAADTTAFDAPVEEIVATDTTVADEIVAADTTAVDEIEEMVAEIVDIPIRILGLVSEGPVTYWSNDGLDALNLDDYLSISMGESALIAVKAKDCLDIVCNLLAADSSDADFIIVTPTDSSNVQIYEISTRTTVIEAPAKEISVAFAKFLGEYLVEEMIADLPVEDVPAEEPAITATGPDRSASLKVRNLQHRNMETLFDNPANLGRDFESNTTWNFVPDFNIDVHNSLLTPGWYKEWFTTGGIWDAATKSEYLSTIMDQDFTISVAPEMKTILGFRIGRYGFNSSFGSYTQVSLPGNLLSLPMRDIYLNDPIDNSGLQVESIPGIITTTLSYAHPLQTAFGDVKLGASLNFFEAEGYARVVSDDFSVTMTEDSVEVHATGEAWATTGGQTGLFDDFEGDVESSDLFSNVGVGIDVGVILDLYDRLDQEVEVQVLLKNLGAQYKWSNVTHELWTYDLKMPVVMDDDDSLEQFETQESTVLSEGEDLSVVVPMVFSVGAIYQPFSKLIVGAGIEKAFIDEFTMGYSDNVEFLLQLNYYPTNWFDISYYMEPKFGDPAHTIGSGFHFGFLDMGMNVTFINGFNSEAKGIGFGFHSSLHF